MQNIVAGFEDLRVANKTMAEDTETLKKNLNQNEPIAKHTHLGTDGKEKETSGNDMEKEKSTKKKRNRKNALETEEKMFQARSLENSASFLRNYGK